MKVQRIGGINGPVHVFGDDAFAKPLAGPFASGPAARCWIVEHIEKGLSPAKLEVWKRVADHLPSPTDFGAELALIEKVANGLPFDRLLHYIRPPDRRQLDRRMMAAGERQTDLLEVSR